MQSIFGEFYTGADGKDYFYLPFLKTVYHIPTDDLVTFNAFRHRFVIAFALGAIFYSFFPSDVLLCVFVGALFYALATVAYLKSILPKYVVQTGVQEGDLNRAKQNEQQGSLAKTLLVSLAGVLIIAGSFFVSGEMVNRMIIIAFGVIVTISGTSSIIGKSK